MLNDAAGYRVQADHAVPIFFIGRGQDSHNTYIINILHTSIDLLLAYHLH